MAPDEPDVSPFSGLIGVDWISNDPEQAKARVEVRDELKQPYGYLHGGVIMSVVDELCSRSTLMQVIMDGTVTARARHRGKTSWVWDVEATDDEGRPCALARMTVAVREFEAPG
jgi:1,4-dihydroxy-2-naphthoyl-CoA hydrolase